MGVIIQIPDDIRDAMRIPRPEIEREIYRELALVMYSRWGLSMGLACRLGGFSKRQFLEILGERGISRHYSEEDLAEDAAYAEGREQ